MGLNTFSTALSGLSSNTQGLNVVGNNLANMNTVGYKTTNIAFTDVLGQVVSGGSGSSSGNVGLGAQVGAVTSVFSQGGFESTNNPTDVAIQGKGFFIVSDGSGQFYTRAGNFQVDAEGSLVSATGHKVQGYTRDPNTGVVDTTTALGDIRVPATTGFSNPTANVELTFNLDALAAVGDTFSTSVQLYDSVGTPHLATIDFVKTTVLAGESRWDFDITVPESEFEGVPATSTQKFSLISGAVASATPDQGTIVFDTNGKMSSVFLGAAPATLPAPANQVISGTGLPTLDNGGSLIPNDLNWNFIGANGELNATGLASTSAVTFNTQDGVPPGQMNSLAVQADGTIAGVFSNGLTLDIAKIAIGQFRSENGLIATGAGMFSESKDSGSVLLSFPGEGGSGRLVGGTLELSNVDLASEFTKIITFQRGYQANARIITATDQILQETMALKQ